MVPFESGCCIKASICSHSYIVTRFSIWDGLWLSSARKHGCISTSSIIQTPAFPGHRDIYGYLRHQFGGRHWFKASPQRAMFYSGTLSGEADGRCSTPSLINFWIKENRNGTRKGVNVSGRFTVASLKCLHGDKEKIKSLEKTLHALVISALQMRVRSETLNS